MQKGQQSASGILCAAIGLFEENGYSQTSMRQIAVASEVSPGLINHHFGSKARLGALTFDVIVSMLSESIDKLMDKYDEPVLYDAVITRLTNLYLLGGIYRQFYIDCLVEDIFWSFLSDRSVDTLFRIMKKEGRPSLSEDELNLYGKYLPYSIEKTLILNKEQGMFQTISYDRVPDYILRTELERFVDSFTISTALEYSRKYCDQILAELPATVPKNFIHNFFALKTGCGL
ncbi:MAG: TetR/AcrR family transcriptional regulator [Clostridium sp.]|nr:TetR/AcrR family transcriptional regulator [Clostridium sp.]